MDLKVGDKVNIIDNGYRYSAYRGWILENAPLCIDVWENDNYKKFDKHRNEEFKVVKIAPHNTYDDDAPMIAFIVNKNIGVLIGLKGLKKVRGGIII